MLTGKYSHEHGTTENIFRDKEPFDGSQMTFPKRLREAGYTTLQVGKWYLESHPTGFDYWKRLPNQGRYNDPVFLEKSEGNGEPSRTQESGYVTDIITEKTIQTLEEYRGDGPCDRCWSNERTRIGTSLSTTTITSTPVPTERVPTMVFGPTGTSSSTTTRSTNGSSSICTATRMNCKMW